MAQKNALRTSFNMYEKNGVAFRTTLFDLFSGRNEVKQTKALAYTLSCCHVFLLKFLRSALPKYEHELKAATVIEVIAELVSESNRRADIVIKIWNNNEPIRAVVIEAKGTNVNAKEDAVNQQVLDYLENENFPSLTAFRGKLTGVVLTKNKIFSAEHSVTWWELISWMAEIKSNPVVSELLKFLTEEKGMKYYKDEVRSIPAAETMSLIRNYGVYTRKLTTAKNMKKALFVTFRKKGGEMDSLYKVVDEVILDSPSDVDRLRSSQYEHKERLLKYIDVHLSKINASTLDDPHVFLILSDKSIDLPKKPKPKKAAQGDVVYSLQEILTERELTPASQQGKHA